MIHSFLPSHIPLLPLPLLYTTELWTLICDAKMRKRRPNGTIITPEEEAAEAEKAKQDVLAKAAMWAEREAHMKTDF